MPTWTHAICEVCWKKKYPGREAHIIVDADLATCCFCGASTGAGIYVRADPRTVEHCECLKG